MTQEHTPTPLLWGMQAQSSPKKRLPSHRAPKSFPLHQRRPAQCPELVFLPSHATTLVCVVFSGQDAWVVGILLILTPSHTILMPSLETCGLRNLPAQ